MFSKNCWSLRSSDINISYVIMYIYIYKFTQLSPYKINISFSGHHSYVYVYGIKFFVFFYYAADYEKLL